MSSPPRKPAPARHGPPRPAPARQAAAKHPAARQAGAKHPAPAATTSRHPEAGDPGPEGERLQKVLAAAGVGSRRACEELIAAGRVTIDGEVVRTMGRRVDPRTAVIHVDGSRVILDDNLVYLALNKPRGVLSTMSDERGRLSVGDYVADRETRVFHVGRLDADSEGLMLLTNDGALAHRLTHPSFGIQKTYLAEVPGPVRPSLRRQLLAGVELDDGPVTVDEFRIVDNLPGRVLVEVVLHEGRKHVVRRLLAEVGHPVQRLVRTGMGPIHLATLKPGKLRRLSRQEIGALYKDVGL
ncbi:MAG TPA: pseudouridine synthase [Kribbellaceae bacterium]